MKFTKIGPWVKKKPRQTPEFKKGEKSKQAKNFSDK